MQEMITNAVGDALRGLIHQGASLIGWQGLAMIVAAIMGVLILHHFAKEVAKKFAVPIICAVIGGVLVLGIVSKPEVQIVEKPVIKEVVRVDYSGQSELHQKINAVENARVQAEAKAIEAESRAKAVEAYRKQAEEQAAALAEKLHAVQPPEGDDVALERLRGQIDTLHEQGVAEDAINIDPSGTRRVFVGRTDDFLGQPIYRDVPDKRADYRNYRTYTHKMPVFDGLLVTSSITTYYHRNCSVCDQNYQAHLKMDEIYARQEREKQQSDPAKIAKEKASKRSITAFGETKSIEEWAKDPICRVDAQELSRRIDEGWEQRKAIELRSAMVPDSFGVGIHFDEYSEAAQYDREVYRKRQAEKEAELERRRRLPDNTDAPGARVESKDTVAAQMRIQNAPPEKREMAIRELWFKTAVANDVRQIAADRFAQEVSKKYARENLGNASLEDQIKTLKAVLAASHSYTETEKQQLGVVIDGTAPLTAKALVENGMNQASARAIPSGASPDIRAPSFKARLVGGEKDSD